MNEHVVDVVGQFGQGVGHGILALATALDEQGRRRGKTRQLERLARITIDDDVEVGGPAGDEGGGGIGEDRPAGQRGHDLVGCSLLHAAALSGGEENGGGAAHGKRLKGLRIDGR